MAIDGEVCFVAGLAARKGKKDGVYTLSEVAREGLVRRCDVSAPIVTLVARGRTAIAVTSELDVLLWDPSGDPVVHPCPPLLRAALDERVAASDVPSWFSHLPKARVRGEALAVGDLSVPCAIAEGGAVHALLSPGGGQPLSNWRFQGGAWADLGPAPDLVGITCAFHGVRNVLVAFGRQGDVNGPSRVAEWDGASWTLYPCRSPGVKTHVSPFISTLRGGQRVVGISGKTVEVYGREGMFAADFAPAGAAAVTEPTAIDAAEGALVLHYVESAYEGGARRVVLRQRDLTAAARYVDASPSPAPTKSAAASKPAKRAPAPKSKTTAKPPTTPSASSSSSDPSLGALFPDPGFALTVLDAMLPFRKGALWFDYDAWIEEGLAQGTLTVGSTDDTNAVRAFKDQNELDMHPALEKALLALPVPKASLAAVRKLDLVSFAKKLIKKFAPQWDGESALAITERLDGIGHLTGLTQLYVSSLHDITRLPDAPALESVTAFSYDSAGKALNPGQEQALDAVRSRGVKVIVKRV
jgi:hypothetical protein